MSAAFALSLLLTICIFTYKSSFASFMTGVAGTARWLALALLCVSMLWAPRLRRGHFAGGKMRTYAFLFAAIALLSSVWSAQKSLYTLQRGLSVILLTIFLFFALIPRLARLKDYILLSKTLSVMGWAAVGSSILLWVVARGEAVRPYTGAVEGIFGNPNMAGMFYAIVLPVAVARFLHKKGILKLALIILMAVLLYLSQSRAGWLGGMFGVGAFFAMFYGKKIWIVLIVALAVLMPLGLTQQTSSLIDDVEESFLRDEKGIEDLGSGRIGLWRVAFDRFKERPFAGYGFGTAGDYYMSDGRPFRWHSSFTQIAVELGIIGIFFFLAPMAYSAFKTFRYHMVEVRSHAVRAVVAGLAGGWFGGMIDAFFESWLFSIGNVASILAWICFVAGMKGMSDARLLDGDEYEAR